LNWTVLLPVLAGGLGVWYLMPGTRPRTLALGGLMGVVALAGVGAFLIRGLGDRIPETVEAVLFFGFSGLAILFAGLMITARNPARSALAFAMVVLSTCGLFLLLAAPFLTAATIIIYAGAIIVTFLFVIMLSQQEGPSNADLRSREPALAAAAGFVLLATLLVGLQRVYDWRTVDAAVAHASRLAQADRIDEEYLSPARPVENMGQDSSPPPLTPKAAAFVAEMRAALDRARIAAPRGGGERGLTDHKYVQEATRAIDGLETYAFRQRDADELRTNCQTISDNLMRLKRLRTGSELFDDVTVSEHGVVHRVEGQPDDPRKLPAANVSALGRTLFSDHLLAVELAGTLLLVATVGAIAIAGGRREGRA
jgi:NADH:ubiquinone oxidoreductase subunit 6 (subunit J)